MQAKSGKTSLIQRYTENTFTEDTLTTLGIDYRVKKVQIQNTTIKLQIWDTAG